MANTLQKQIEIFRAGTFSPMEGNSISFTENDVQTIADNYDPDKYMAPLVIGHPKHDAPAFGWVKALSFSGEKRLVATNDDVDPAFAAMVEDGKFRKVSASFFGPSAKNNPTPGSFSLKHVGMLGAAAPAVSGLKTITEAAFADNDDDVTFEFTSEGTLARAIGTIGEILQSLRDGKIDSDGLDEADKIIPSYKIKWIEEAVSEGSSQAFSEVEKAAEENQPSDNPQAKETSMNEDELNARARALDEREKELRTQENRSFVDGQIAKGKLVAGTTGDMITSFMNSLTDDTESVSFADGAPQTQLGAFKAIIEAFPENVSFGEHKKGDDPTESEGDTASFATVNGKNINLSRQDLHNRAVAFQSQNPGTEYLAAVKAVGGQ